MLDRKTPPVVCDFESISLVPPKPSWLRNGIVIKEFDNPNLDLIHFSVVIRAGALYEPLRRISSTCYALLRESHKTMTSNEIDAFFDYYGADVNISTGMNFVTLKALMPKRNCLKILPFLADLLIEPDFKEDNLSRLLEKKIKDWEYQSKKTDNRVTQLLFHTFYDGLIPFGKLLERADFDVITLKSIADYHRETCCAENIRIFVCGNVDQEIRDCIRHAFERIPSHRPAPELPEGSRFFHPQRIVENWPQSLQTSIMLCRPSLPYTAPETLDFRFMQTLFCNYFGSRLMQNLREKNGYTYGIGGSVAYCGKDSIFYISSEVNNDKADAAIEACYDEMRRLQTEKPSDEEMVMVRNYMLGSALRSIDGTVSYMLNYSQWDDFGKDENWFYQYLSAIKKMSAQQVCELAVKYLQPDAFTVIEVGKLVD